MYTHIIICVCICMRIYIYIYRGICVCAYICIYIVVYHRHIGCILFVQYTHSFTFACFYISCYPAVVWLRGMRSEARCRLAGPDQRSSGQGVSARAARYFFNVYLLPSSGSVEKCRCVQAECIAGDLLSILGQDNLWRIRHVLKGP